MRGRLFVSYNKTTCPGNTPAYAGKTKVPQRRAPARRKHPRVCGEDGKAPERTTFNEETPPRMRGRLRCFRPCLMTAGNTPAYAGKTFVGEAEQVPGEKHPRVCGEDSLAVLVRCPLTETPPRMRGRLFRNFWDMAHKRNTPAYAGKTGGESQHRIICRKHPRVCGEDCPARSYLYPPRETPPRMRGRRHYCQQCGNILGNTPAYAGKTDISQRMAATIQKHPRVCGEDLQSKSPRIALVETPPRMRGRPWRIQDHTASKRNTPAYAGKTDSRPPLRSKAQKHPRVCGEDPPMVAVLSP